MTNRTITYDILIDDENGHPTYLYTGLEPKRFANGCLRMARRHEGYPKAYLVKVVETRCPELRKPYWKKRAAALRRTAVSAA